MNTQQKEVHLISIIGFEKFSKFIQESDTGLGGDEYGSVSSHSAV